MTNPYKDQVETNPQARSMVDKLKVDPRSFAEIQLWLKRHPEDQWFHDNQPLESQVAILAHVILTEFEGEPSQSQGAIETAIRIMRKQQVDLKIADTLLSEAQERSIEARNPGIDMEEVRRHRVGLNP